jgi:hypothetical protein
MQMHTCSRMDMPVHMADPLIQMAWLRSCGCDHIAEIALARITWLESPARDRIAEVTRLRSRG